MRQSFWAVPTAPYSDTGGRRDIGTASSAAPNPHNLAQSPHDAPMNRTALAPFKKARPDTQTAA